MWLFWPYRFSGVLLWDFLGLPWELKRWLLWHAPVSLTVLSFYLLPYAISHIRRYAPWLKGRGSIKGYIARIGVSVLLIASVSSGFWLMFIGATGNNVGIYGFFASLGLLCAFFIIDCSCLFRLTGFKGVFCPFIYLSRILSPPCLPKARSKKRPQLERQTLFLAPKRAA